MAQDVTILYMPFTYCVTILCISSSLKCEPLSLRVATATSSDAICSPDK